MLAIRMQRTGRKGHAHFRVLVQDSRQTPTSGKFVAQLGSYDPHTKATTLDKEKAAFYLEHGARPSDRVVVLLKQEGLKIPNWVKEPVVKEGKIRNQEKLRKNRPDEPEAPVVEEATPAEADVPEAAEPSETVEASGESEAAPEAETADTSEASADTTDETPATT